MGKRPLTGWKAIGDYLGIHPRTAMRWAEDEGLPVVKIGDRMVSTPSAIEVWILNNMILDRKVSQAGDHG